MVGGLLRNVFNQYVLMSASACCSYGFDDYNIFYRLHWFPCIVIFNKEKWSDWFSKEDRISVVD